MSPSDRNEKLERALRDAVQGLPARRAPSSLERRVLAELERRAALPWWRKSFRHWPLAARALFVVACFGFVKLALSASAWVMSGFDTAQLRAAFAQPIAWFEAALAVGNAFSGFIDILSRNIPALWLYAGAAFVVTLYATVFGLGAVAYKALHAER